MKKSVDVITPCRNAERYIKDCIESVRKSVTFNNFAFTHYVVDDDSSDRTVEILENVKHSHVKKIFLKKHEGHAAARNKGFAAGSSPYIFFLDSDDLLLQNSLRYLIDYAEKTGSNWVYGDFIRCDEESRYIIGEDYYGWDFLTPAEVLVAMYTGGHFFQQNNLFSRKIIEDVGGFDDTLERAVDFDLCTRLLLAGHVPVHYRSALYLHRYHDSNLSHAHKTDADLHRRIVSRIYARHNTELSKLLKKTELQKIERYLS